jgi:hypothetical protein
VAQIARRSFCAGSAVTAYSVERYEKYCRFPRLTWHLACCSWTAMRLFEGFFLVVTRIAVLRRAERAERRW